MLGSEARLMGRSPGVLIWTVLLPVTACVVLASIPGVRETSPDLGGLSLFQIYQPILIFFTMTLLSVQGLPSVVTRYREMGVLKRLRTTPVSAALLLFAHLTLILAVAVACLAVMVVVPALVGAGWPRDPGGFLLAYLLGAWAMLGLGLVVAGLFRSARFAAGLGSFLFFVLQFLAGLWLPRPAMPTWLLRLSDVTPSGAAVQSLTDASLGHWPGALHLIVLAAWGAVGSHVAIRYFQWD
ncbi:ABC transporter permease [Streptomyces sp. AJS327]|nr:ABC transporter permease [Streptomyces sp. AJS327]